MVLIVPPITQIIGHMNSIKKKSFDDMKEKINKFFQDLIDELLVKFNQTVEKIFFEIPEIAKIEPRTIIKVVSVSKFVSFEEKYLVFALDKRRSNIFDDICQECANQRISLECTPSSNGFDVSCRYMVKETKVERHSCALLAAWLFCEEAIEQGGKNVSIEHDCFLQDFVDEKLWKEMNQPDPFDILSAHYKIRNFILHIGPHIINSDVKLELTPETY